MLFFLESNRASLLSICADRSDQAWRRNLISVSSDIAKFFVLPCEKSLSPLKYDSLKSQVEEIMGSLCIGLKAFFSEEVFSTLFRKGLVVPSSNDHAICAFEDLSTS